MSDVRSPMREVGPVDRSGAYLVSKVSFLQQSTCRLVVCSPLVVPMKA